MTDETAELILQEIRALGEKIEAMSAQIARLTAKIERPDLVKRNVNDAAKRLGISRSAVYREIKAGQLESVKERGRRFVTEEACQTWERRQRRDW